MIWSYAAVYFLGFASGAAAFWAVHSRIERRVTSLEGHVQRLLRDRKAD